MILVYTEKGVVNLVHETDDEEKVFQGEVLLAEGDEIHINEEEIVCLVNNDPVWKAKLVPYTAL